MTTFAEIGIRGDIARGLEVLEFTLPTPVQNEVLPVALRNEDDIVALAQTGTGKTAAFGIPLIQLSDVRIKKTQALILCPTRELCVQVTGDMTRYARYVDGLKIEAVYGGAGIEKQISAIKRGVQIIVATPGRLLDLIRRQAVNISTIQWVVLDEADEMLNMGFQEDLNAILDETPATRRTLLFSATMPAEVAAIAARYMKSPVEITIGRRNAGAENVRHVYYLVQARDRYLALKRIADMHPDIYSIIFCRTRQETREVAEKLMRDGYNADALHGELSQGQRDAVMDKFRRRNLQLLVATDVAARGLDVVDLTHVINYNLPDELIGYTHRSGRTGRAGKRGVSIAIIHAREKYKIRELEKKLNKKFENARIPTGREICEKQLLRLLDSVTRIEVDHEQMESFLPEISRTLDGLDRAELINRFVSFEFNRFFSYYRNAPDLNLPEKKPEKKSAPAPWKEKKTGAGSPVPSKKFRRFFLNVGKKDGVTPERLIGEINDAAGNSKKIKIGRIDILSGFTLLDADSTFTPEILNTFKDLMINGKPVAIEISRPDNFQPESKDRKQSARGAGKSAARKPEKKTGKKKQKGEKRKAAGSPRSPKSKKEPRLV